MTVSIDASVWVAARFENQPDYSASVACLRSVLASEESIVLPWLAWVETVCSEDWVRRACDRSRPVSTRLAQHSLG